MQDMYSLDMINQLEEEHALDAGFDEEGDEDDLLCYDADEENEGGDADAAGALEQEAPPKGKRVKKVKNAKGKTRQSDAGLLPKARKAFALFTMDKYPEMQEKYPDLHGSTLLKKAAKELGNMWKAVKDRASLLPNSLGSLGQATLSIT